MTAVLDPLSVGVGAFVFAVLCVAIFVYVCLEMRGDE